LAASIGLIAAYLAFGGATYEPDRVADPCETREAEVLAQRDTFEAIALSALDGAACELQVSREELTLALADEESTAEFAAARGIDEGELEEAVRAGLVRAVDDQAATGAIDGIEETLLRQLAEQAPVDAAIEALQSLPGDASIQDVIGQLADLSQTALPSIEDLEQLLP
jgi:hypothetical protein